MDAFTLNLLKNREVLAINEDPLSVQGKPVVANGSIQIWTRPLADGPLAVGVFNLGYATEAAIVDLAALELEGPQLVRDTWRHADVRIFEDSFEVELRGHASVLYKLSQK